MIRVKSHFSGLAFLVFYCFQHPWNETPFHFIPVSLGIISGSGSFLGELSRNLLGAIEAKQDKLTGFVKETFNKSQKSTERIKLFEDSDISGIVGFVYYITTY